MGYSKNVSEKALFYSNNNLETALKWIEDNKNQPDFEVEERAME
jgi:hypothetical protein